jgi:hypothetical protein
MPVVPNADSQSEGDEGLAGLGLVMIQHALK